MREMREIYQKAHHPEKHWQRFSKEVACKINFSTCMGTVRTTSGLKSRPGNSECHYQPHALFGKRKKRDRHCDHRVVRTRKLVLHPVVNRKCTFVSRFLGL